MNRLKEILEKRKKSCKSIWFMRQAGRYLPEFREVRSKNPNFIKLCLNSDLSSKITLQPIDRFDLDYAIIFSDILIVPYALGQEVKFIKNEGPLLNKFNLNIFSKNNKDDFKKTLLPVYESIAKTKKNLTPKKLLISFIGAPWTLLIYMFGMKKNKDKLNLTVFNENKTKIDKIFKELTEYLKIHIYNQYEAGADIVQIFDSWAGIIPKEYLQDYCFEPNLDLVKFCNKKNIPVICFPKGLKNDYKEFNNFVNPDGISIDSEIDPAWARDNLKQVVLQGGMSPKSLLGTEEKMILEAKKYLDTFKDIPYIFNLGHGVLPETNPKVLEKLVNFVRSYK